MYIPVKSILFFLLKVVLIEWTIEGFRFGIFFLWHKQFPEVFFRPNRGINLYFNLLESLVVIGLLYYAFNPVVIVLFVLMFIFLVQKTTEFITGRTFIKK